MSSFAERAAEFKRQVAVFNAILAEHRLCGEHLNSQVEEIQKAMEEHARRTEELNALAAGQDNISDDLRDIGSKHNQRARDLDKSVSDYNALAIRHNIQRVELLTRKAEFEKKEAELRAEAATLNIQL